MERIDGPLKFGKLLWYDPNPADNEPIRLEDLTISVDLEVTSKTRSIILVNQQAGTASVNSNGTQTVVNVNFFEGSAYNDERALTTHYTDIQNLNNTLNDDYEALNIESINIDFNSSYAPMIKIKFIDIRGAAMFSRNGEGKYKFFFELPYPIFNLTIKGFYGKSVQYCIHLIRFNASFNSQTGNFEIDCDFIGFTYALLADMLMGIVRGSVGTVRGKAIFEKIKGEYKNQDAIITVDELVARISEVNEKVGKIKSGEDGKQLALIDKSKSEVENLRQTVLTFLDTCASGQEIFTRAYSNGILIISTPDSDRDKIINTAKDNYRINSAKKINDDIKKLIDFNANTVIRQALDVNNDGVCPNFVGWLEVTNIPVTKISNTGKLTPILEAEYYSGNRLTNMITLLQSINYSGTDNIRVIDLSSAIKACDTAIAEIEKINTGSIKTATDSLKSGIKEVLGFDPTIRNLFRVLCISTEVFLECMVDISKEAETDNGGKRAVELNKLRNGLDDVSKSNKVFPWPEYRKSSAQSDGYYEEWMGNEPIVVDNVPELQFTEELLEVMIEQKKQDLLREEELTGGLDWYPISVIDTPVDSGLTARITENPYKIGLMSELADNVKPKGEADEALRVMMYRAFLLLGATNRNAIASDLIKLHAKLEAENLYDVLKKMPVSSVGVDIKNTITNSNAVDIMKKFEEGVNLVVSGDKMNKPFFKNLGTGQLEYRYIWHESSDRSVIPVNGYFSGEKFFSDIATNTLLSPYGISPFRDAGALFVGNAANHVRTGAPYDPKTQKFTTGGSSAQLDGSFTSKIGTQYGIDNSRKRRNYQVSDGSVYVKVISEGSYNNSSNFITPTFGKDVLSGYNAPIHELYGEIASAIDDPTNNHFYNDPINGNYLSNQYSQINYKINGANESRYTSDAYTGVDPANPQGGTATAFIAFFNEGSLNHEFIELVDIQTPTNTYKAPLPEISYNGFATEYNSKSQRLGWHTFNNGGNINSNTNGLYRGHFIASNTITKNIIYHYTDYGKNRQLLNNALVSGKNIYVPKIEFCVDTYVSCSLFGTRFYYYQNSLSDALASGNFGVTLGAASRAFLFLHCFPFQGVAKKHDDVWDRFMFDFNSDKIQESSPNVDNPASEILGIKSLFRFHNAFIEAPKIWALFIGAILWRIRYYNINTNDPIEWYTPESNNGGMLIPGMRLNGFPRSDEFLNVVLDGMDYMPSGMHFNSSGANGYPFTYSTNSGTEEPEKGAYSRIDETIMGLPEQVKNEFINDFLYWVSSGFKAIQEELEIKFKEGTPGTRAYLDDYRQKWVSVNNAYTVYPDSTNNETRALPVSIIKSELGDNIYENYIMVCPINMSGGAGRFSLAPMTDDEKKKYVNNQFLFNMELNADGGGMNLITKLLKEKVYIQNVVPKIWNPPNIISGLRKLVSGYTPIRINEIDLKTFVSEFHNHLESISKDMENEIQTEEKEIQQALFNTQEEDKIKLNLYRTLMSIYQKWVGGLKKTMFTQCGSFNKSDLLIARHERNVANEPRLIDSFRFLDRSFNDIGDTFYMNPEIFYRLITKNTNASFFDVANKVLSENNFNFIPLPSFVNFNDGKALADIFEPYPYNDPVATGPSFVCVYAGQSSTNLDLGATSNYPDDGIFIRIDPSGNFVPGTMPEDLNNLNALTVYETNVPVFTVNYGQQNQNYFKDVKLDQKEFAETAESLEIIDDISQGGDKRKSVMVGQNLFNTYQKRSYSCEVEMLGCALIQPMMYFQLNNIPMFRGLYLIINVSHTIRPNSMTTTFKGVRVKKTKTPLLSASDVLMNLVGDVSSVGTSGSQLGNVTFSSGCGKSNPVDIVKTDPDFIAKVKEVATNVKCDYTHLFGLMETESACSFSPAVFNGVDHYGLIQFANSYKGTLLFYKKAVDTTKGLTAKDQLTKLTRVEQMDYVEGYIKLWKKSNGMTNDTLTPSDLYMLIFLPALTNKPETYVIATKTDDPSGYWMSNPALRDNSRPDKDIWKGYLGLKITAAAAKYSVL